MASFPLHRNYELQSPLVRVGASKAQAGLAKIIAVISSISPPLDRESDPLVNTGTDSEAKTAKVGFGLIDLNLRLSSLQENEEEEGRSAVENGVDADPVAPAESIDVSNVPTVEDSISPAESAAGDAPTAEKSSEGECDPENVGEEGENKVKEDADAAATKEISEITTVPRNRNGNEDGEAERGSGSEGYLGLLLEAARTVSGDIFDDESPKKKHEPSPPPSPAVAVEEDSVARRVRSKRRRTFWHPALEFYKETAPVVRSKRGRNQSLPSRYRDSVLEPWAKLPTVSRQGRTAKQ